MRDEFVLGELGPETSKMGSGSLITLFHLICFKNQIYLCGCGYVLVPMGMEEKAACGIWFFYTRD